MVCICGAGERCAAAEHPSYPVLAAQHETQQHSATGDANFVWQIVKLLVSVLLLPVTCVAFACKC
jgi:hypothetical protein